MTGACAEIHRLFHGMTRFSFPFDASRIPLNGIYVLFERGETGHGSDRVVRIGTHTGNRNLPTRLMEHFLHENKDRSVFRKNIGRAILNKNHDPFLDHWNVDLTGRDARERHAGTIDLGRKQEIEQQVTSYIQQSFSFVVLEVPSKEERLRLEARLISTVFRCDKCHPSGMWLGRFSPSSRIREGGLWQVNELDGDPLTEGDVDFLKVLCAQGSSPTSQDN